MTTMDQIHRIRELYYEQDKNLNEIAIIMGCDWRTVRKYADMEDFSSPPPTPASTEVHESKLDPFKPLIDEWLQADKLAPRKQRHSATESYGACQCALQGLEIMQVETLPGKELTNPPEVSFELLLVTIVAKRKQRDSRESYRAPKYQYIRVMVPVTNVLKFLVWRI